MGVCHSDMLRCVGYQGTNHDDMKANRVHERPDSVVMYIDMNSFFASCEQQDQPQLIGKPVGVVPFLSPTACVIAPSIEAKKFGVKTGMRFYECRRLCPEIIPIAARPFRYRQYHVQIMDVLKRYCDDIVVRSIDEAALHLTSYRKVYPDMERLARDIKQGIYDNCGSHIHCSIGIAPNTFMAKLGTEFQKPNGLVRITPDNVDDYLARLKLTDIPGIGARTEKRLNRMGIQSVAQLRQASPAFLRRLFGGVVGDYWFYRLHFMEVDLVQNPYRGMSAMRTVSSQQRNNPEELEHLYISLCARLEQRMVKQGVFCKEASLHIRYSDHTEWETKVRFAHPVQDGAELRRYLNERMGALTKSLQLSTLFNNRTQSIGIAIKGFVRDSDVQYTLFDNRMMQDRLRKVLYAIKDRFGRDVVRRASETVSARAMKDAIGFGSVKDFMSEDHFNQYLLEE